MMNRLLVFLFLFHLPLVGSSQVLENYKGNWVNQSDLAFWDRTEQKDVLVDVNSFPESYFQFYIPRGSTVFIDGKLWRLFPSDTSFTIPTDELAEQFGGDSLKVSIIGPRSSFGSFPLSLFKVAQVGLDKGKEIIGHLIELMPPPWQVNSTIHNKVRTARLKPRNTIAILHISRAYRYCVYCSNKLCKPV